MAGPYTDESQLGHRLPGTAFLLYHPKTETLMEQVFYNAESQEVLSGINPFIDPASLCTKWVGLLNVKPAVQSNKSDHRGVTETRFIDLCESGRRHYGIRGFILWDLPVNSPAQTKRYLFLFERISQEGVNLCMIARVWGLSRREQEILRLLLVDKSNKEIAHHLNLSLNTIKGYLKLLMRKLGVGSRAGVLTRVLTLTGGDLKSSLPESIASSRNQHFTRSIELSGRLPNNLG